jgi:signal peptidase II
LKKIIKEYWLLLAVTSIILIFDQITKSIVRVNIPFSGYWMPLEWLAPYFRIVHWENHGAAFGMFQQGGMIFAILAVVVSIFIIIYYPQIPKSAHWMRIALAMQLGGALGNLIDRILFGPVLDFLSVGKFPVFNIADASITVGVTLLLISLWLIERKEKQKEWSVDEMSLDNPETIDHQS